MADFVEDQSPGKAGGFLRLITRGCRANPARRSGAPRLIALRWGPAAVALAMGFAAIFAYILNIIALRRLIGLDIVAYHAQAWPALVGTVVMAAAVLWTDTYLAGLASWIALAINLAVGALAAALVMGVRTLRRKP